MIRIVLIDDHAIVRAGVKALVNSEEGLSVVGDAATGEHALELVAELKPDVAVVDMAMPDIQGQDLISSIIEISPETKCLVLSMQSDEVYVQSAFKNGATGYLLKESTTECLIEGIKTVALGKRFLGPILIERAMDAYLNPDNQKQTTSKMEKGALTVREQEILKMISDGFTSIAIGNKLGISVRTVDTHRANIMNKLGVRSQAELVRHAITSGIIKS